MTPLAILLALFLVSAALFSVARNCRIARLERKIDRLRGRIDRLKRQSDRKSLREKTQRMLEHAKGGITGIYLRNDLEINRELARLRMEKSK